MRASPAGLSSFVFAAVLILQVGCGKPFDVKKNVKFPATEPAANAEAGSVTIHALALVDEDALYDAFDANLILAGVLAIRVKLSNAGSEPVELKGLRFELRSEAGTAFERLDARGAYKRLMSYYKISNYNIAGYKESRGDFESYALNGSVPLAGGDAREGLIFFRVPSEADRAGLVLVAQGLQPKSAAIKLKLGKP